MPKIHTNGCTSLGNVDTWPKCVIEKTSWNVWTISMEKSLAIVTKCNFFSLPNYQQQMHLLSIIIVREEVHLTVNYPYCVKSGCIYRNDSNRTSRVNAWSDYYFLMVFKIVVDSSQIFNLTLKSTISKCQLFSFRDHFFLSLTNWNIWMFEGIKS